MKKNRRYLLIPIVFVMLTKNSLCVMSCPAYSAFSSMNTLVNWGTDPAGGGQKNGAGDPWEKDPFDWKPQWGGDRFGLGDIGVTKPPLGWVGDGQVWSKEHDAANAQGEWFDAAWKMMRAKARKDTAADEFRGIRDRMNKVDKDLEHDKKHLARLRKDLTYLITKYKIRNKDDKKLYDQVSRDYQKRIRNLEKKISQSKELQGKLARAKDRKNAQIRKLDGEFNRLREKTDQAKRNADKAKDDLKAFRKKREKELETEYRKRKAEWNAEMARRRRKAQERARERERRKADRIAKARRELAEYKARKERERQAEIAKEKARQQAELARLRAEQDKAEREQRELEKRTLEFDVKVKPKGWFFNKYVDAETVHDQVMKKLSETPDKHTGGLYRNPAFSSAVTHTKAKNAAEAANEVGWTVIKSCLFKGIGGIKAINGVSGVGKYVFVDNMVTATGKKAGLEQLKGAYESAVHALKDAGCNVSVSTFGSDRGVTKGVSVTIYNPKTGEYSISTKVVSTGNSWNMYSGRGGNLPAENDYFIVKGVARH